MSFWSEESGRVESVTLSQTRYVFSILAMSFWSEESGGVEPVTLFQTRYVFSVLA